MKKILAVSGGIDSMVMMHMHRGDLENVIVAHFDHGIRPNSADDFDFVKREADKLGMSFIGEHACLGKDCSEEKARQERYAFLGKCAEDNDAQIVVAHHADDIIESIIINILRGTGWRGLAPMQNMKITRPLRGLTKADIYRYAAINNVSFRHDQSNSDDKYLRNRVREWMLSLDEEEKNRLKSELLRLHAKQCAIGEEVSQILECIGSQEKYSRKAFYDLDDEIAIEILRCILKRNGHSLTRPQLARALEAIRVYGTNTKFSLNKGSFINILRSNFTVDLC